MKKIQFIDESIIDLLKQASTLFDELSISINLELDLLLLNGVANRGRSLLTHFANSIGFLA